MRLGSCIWLRSPKRAFLSPAKRCKVDEAIRVDQAGEVAAVRICRYQLFWMSPFDSSMLIVKDILRDEVVHERTMNELASKHSVRLTSLDPLFNLGAFVMGTATAFLGKEAMMCCHAAVEVTIAKHYNDQLRELETLGHTEEPQKGDEAEAWNEIKDTVAKFRDEEVHHQHLGEDNGAAQAPLYPLLYNGIRLSCKLGIALAKRF